MASLICRLLGCDYKFFFVFFLFTIQNSANASQLGNQGRIFLITPNLHKYPGFQVTRIFPSLFNFNNAVKCIYSNDQILIEGGIEYFGRLKFQECNDEKISHQKQIVIRNFNPAYPLDGRKEIGNAIIRVAASASELNLKPELVKVPYYQGKPVSHLAGRNLFKIGPLPASVGQLFYKGQRLPLARFPDDPALSNRSRYVPLAEALESGNGCDGQICLKFTDKATKRNLAELEIIEGNVIADTYIVVRNSPWSLARAKIKKVTNGDLVHLNEPLHGEGRATKTVPTPGHGALFMNSFAFLSTAGEWYFNQEDRYIYMLWDDHSERPLPSDLRFSFDEDRGHERVKFDNAGIAIFFSENTKMDDDHYFKIHGLTVHQAAGSGIRVVGAKNVEISNVEIHAPMLHGITLRGIQNRASILDSKIINVGAFGITVAETPVVEISRNTIQGAGYIGTQQQMEMAFSGVNIAPGFTDVVVNSNIISNTGYAGIMVAEHAQDAMSDLRLFNLKIINNDISSFCKLLNDCGGIYINGQNKKPLVPQAERAGTKAIMANNIYKPLSNMDGTPYGVVESEGGRKPMGDWEEMVAAIYLDKKASNYEIRSNYISGYYRPYSWMIRGGGFFNACELQDINRCNLMGKNASEIYQCYTKKLDRCNIILR